MFLQKRPNFKCNFALNDQCSAVVLVGLMVNHIPTLMVFYRSSFSLYQSWVGTCFEMSSFSVWPGRTSRTSRSIQASGSFPVSSFVCQP